VTLRLNTEDADDYIHVTDISFSDS